MKIVTQPRHPCKTCPLDMIGMGTTGSQDLYHCEGCGRMEWIPRIDRRGSARKRATDDPYEIVACSGVIENEQLIRCKEKTRVTGKKRAQCDLSVGHDGAHVASLEGDQKVAWLHVEYKYEV